MKTVYAVPILHKEVNISISGTKRKLSYSQLGDSIEGVIYVYKTKKSAVSVAGYDDAILELEVVDNKENE